MLQLSWILQEEIRGGDLGDGRWGILGYIYIHIYRAGDLGLDLQS